MSEWFLLIPISLKVIGVVLVCVVLVFEARQGRRASVRHGAAWWLLAAFSLFYVVWLAVRWASVFAQPVPHTLAEQEVFGRLQAMLQGRLIYGDASLTPPSVNPLFYVIALPFAWFFGPSLMLLRIIALAGVVCAAISLALIIHRQMASWWWTWAALGLFARLCILTGDFSGDLTPISWLLACTLLGSYLIARNHSEGMKLVGLVLLIEAFWFHQAGAIFLMGGLLFLTWRDGERASLLYWVLATTLAVAAWAFLAPLLFGERFHQFTVSGPNPDRLFAAERWLQDGRYWLNNFPLLILAGLCLLVVALWRRRALIDLPMVQFLCALLFGGVAFFVLPVSPGILAPGVLALAGVWAIVVGLRALQVVSLSRPWFYRWQLHLLILFASFWIFGR
jgi:hypothetical protein